MFSSTRDCQTGAAVGLLTWLPRGNGCGTSFPFPHPLGPSSQHEWAHIPIVGLWRALSSLLDGQDLHDGRAAARSCEDSVAMRQGRNAPVTSRTNVLLSCHHQLAFVSLQLRNYDGHIIAPQHYRSMRSIRDRDSPDCASCIAARSPRHAVLSRSRGVSRLNRGSSLQARQERSRPIEPMLTAT